MKCVKTYLNALVGGTLYIYNYIQYIHIYLHHLSLSILVYHIISYIDCKALNSVESLIIDRPQYLSHIPKNRYQQKPAIKPGISVPRLLPCLVNKTIEMHYIALQ